MVKYSDKNAEVIEGDVVKYRSMVFRWKWKDGYISYVPGKSKYHPEMEHSGLAWVGVTGKDGTFRGVVVDPEKNTVKNNIKFISRADGSKCIGPHDIPADEW